MTKQDIEMLLDNIVPVDDENYAFQIRNLIPDNTTTNSLFFTYLKDIHEDKYIEMRLRQNAFYLTLVILWRLKEYQQYRTLVTTNQVEFLKFKMYDTFKSQSYFSNTKNESNLLTALDFSEKAILKLPSSPNVLHLFSQITSECIEQFNFDKTKTIKKAKETIDRAIAITNGQYPKYFATRSRINAKLNYFDKAKEDIRLAIEKETSNNIDYPIRMGEYQNIKIRINYLQNVKKLLDKQEEVIKTFDHLRLQVIQLLGMLTAVIAFIVSSVQIARNFELNDAYKLIIVTTGMCLLLFSCFSMLFFIRRVRPIQYIIAIFSILMIFITIITL